MCQGGVQNGLLDINKVLLRDESGKPGINNKTTGEIQYLGESERKHYERIGKKRQKEADEMASQQNALMAQQQAESQRLQVQMVEQQQEQSKEVAGLQVQQAEKLSGIKSRGQSVVSSLRILGQKQPMAPTASQTASRPSGRGAASTQANVARGSARSRGTNLSI
tara:strand:- start:2636 stop:3130 length:495 start_codon:yes stop_codon:yes gene_type:complete